jgi:hypothetical protein
MTLHTSWRGALKPPRVLLSALITLVTLIGCGGGGGRIDLEGPFADDLGGTLSGLVGSRLTLQDNSMALSQLNGPAANGTNLVFGLADFNTSYDVTVATQPTNPSQSCVVANGTGTATGSIGSASNVTNIMVT